MKITKLTPNFEVTDVKKSVAYYTENFGFKLIMTVPATQDAIEQGFAENKEYVYAMMQKDNVEIFFNAPTHSRKMLFLHKVCQSEHPFHFIWTLKELRNFIKK